MRSSTIDSDSSALEVENFKEIAAADEAKTIADSIESVKKKISEGRKAEGVAKRDAHAKPHGCVRGTLAVAANRDPRTKYGIFKDAKSYQFWGRVSDAQLLPNSGDDRIPDARGFALKIMGVIGPKEAGFSTNTVDMHFVNSPVFIADDIKEYSTQLSNPGSILGTRGALLSRLLQVTAMKDPLYGTYSSITAQKLGPNAVKYRMVPCAGEREESIFFGGSNYLRDAMRNHLNNRAACMNIQAQFFVNENVTPIEKSTVEWKEADSKFFTIATVTVPKQSFELPERETFCENMAFNPWRVLQGQRPLGSLNRARKTVYLESAKFRTGLNRTQVVEPTGMEQF
jgi:hypothetical protein